MLCNRKEEHVFLQQDVPYTKEICSWISLHYKDYMEYVREGCLKKDEMLCNRYGKAELVGPKFSRIPAPYPDPDNAGHYHPISKTPRTINGKARAIDDLAPTANTRKLFKDGSISSSNCEF